MASINPLALTTPVSVEDLWRPERKDFAAPRPECRVSAVQPLERKASVVHLLEPKVSAGVASNLRPISNRARTSRALQAPRDLTPAPIVAEASAAQAAASEAAALAAVEALAVAASMAAVALAVAASAVAEAAAFTAVEAEDNVQ